MSDRRIRIGRGWVALQLALALGAVSARDAIGQSVSPNAVCPAGTERPSVCWGAEHCASHAREPQDVELLITPRDGCSCPGHGGLCIAYRGRATATLRVHRMYGGNAGRDGSYYAFDLPPRYEPGAAEALRARFAICDEFNSLVCVRVCVLRPGAILTYGPTQSAACRDGTAYPQTGSLQVLPKDPQQDEPQECEDYRWDTSASADAEAQTQGCNRPLPSALTEH